MYLDFNKESLFFLTDEDYLENIDLELDYKNLIKSKYLSDFFSLLNLMIYYTDTSSCNNFVLIDYDVDFTDKLKKFFPEINFYIDYESSLQNLKKEGLNFAMIFNNSLENMKFSQVLITKYDPYIAMVNYHFDNDLNYYLDGLLLRDYFSIDRKARLIIRGLATRKWRDDKIENRWRAFQNCREKNKYLNPIDNTKSTIYMEKGLYNSMDDCYITLLAIDYLKKINKNPSYNNVVKILTKFLGDINLDIIRLID